MAGSVQNVEVPSAWRRWRTAVLLIGALISLLWGWLALPIAFATFICAVTLDELRARGAWRAGMCVLLSALFSTVGLTRFVVGEAMSGIVNGGRTAVQRKAVSHLREILFAQDAMRRAGWIDPDSDGVGSAPLLIELCGGGPLRGQKARSAPVLRCSSRTEGALGTTTDEGAFRFVVCLPKSGGGWTARDVDALDEERAEQEFVAYAWPAPESSFHRAFFIDAKERILTRTVPVRPSRPGELEQGERWEPSCDEAISPGDSSPWEVWRGKKPRKPTP